MIRMTDDQQNFLKIISINYETSKKKSILPLTCLIRYFSTLFTYNWDNDHDNQQHAKDNFNQ